MNINQEIEKEEMKVQNLVKDWHSQKLVSFIDDLIKKDRAEQLILSSVSIALPSPDKLYEMAGTIVDRQGKMFSVDKNSIDWEDLKNDWFDWLDDEIKGNEC